MLTTQHTTQIITPFGSGYVPEQHRDINSAQLNTVVASLRESMFAELLNSLRSMLFVRHAC